MDILNEISQSPAPNGNNFSIMLAQLQNLYPQACLISELVQIYQGKYIVRASVQIEGVTRATGMASAETLEDAEDRARSRALMVLGIAATSQKAAASSLEPITQVQPIPSLSKTSGFNESASSATINSIPQTEPTVQLKSDTIRQDLDRGAFFSQQQAQFDFPNDNLDVVSGELKDNQSLPDLPPSNVTPFTPRSYTPPQQDVVTPTAKKSKKSEPVDLSDAITKTDIEMQRLHWTPEQGREYLKKTYGKIARSLLKPEELLDFLKYLESQPAEPTPPDPIAGF